MFINYEEFLRQVKNSKSSHWDSYPLSVRWSYHQKVIEILKGIDFENSSEILEIGTVGVQVAPGSDTMDLSGYWNYENKNPTYLHDARCLPWPMLKKYKVIVALRVFQYLFPFQKECFLEAKSKSRYMIILVPKVNLYKPKGLENSKGISYQDFTEWNDGKEPCFYEEIDMGGIYFWKFD